MKVESIKSWARKKARMIMEESGELHKYNKYTHYVHHVDGNPLNNNPSNLKVVKKHDHKRIHSNKK
jgi:hypothetical protein